MARFADVAQDDGSAGHAGDEVSAESLASLAAQVRELHETLSRQHEMIARQEELLRQERDARARQDEIIARLQSTMPSERQPARTRQAANATAPRTRRRPESADAASPGGKRGRRALLKGAGVAAAAATVALVASEGQRTHAARATDNQPLVVGQDNSTAGTTSLTANSGSSPHTLFQVDVTNSGDTSGPVAISGVSNISGFVTTNSVGVYGQSNAGHGVQGESSGGVGVYGHSDFVEGVAGSGGLAGVSGSSSGDGVGGRFSSTSGLDLSVLGTGRILQILQSQGGPPLGNHQAGESIRDSSGDLWLCTSGNGSTNGTWVKVAHLAPGATAGGATTYLSKPVRLLDTRNIDDALNNGNGNPLASNGSNPSYTLTVAGVSYNTVDVPASAVGAIGNVTVVATPAGFGYVALVPQGAGFAGTSNINYGASQIIANFFNVGLSGGAIDIYIGGSPTHVIIDIFAVVA